MPAFLLFMIHFAKLGLVVLLVLAIATATPAQVAKKAPPTDLAGVAERGAKLAESGHCREALPLLKKSFPQVSEKDLKLRTGFAAVRCAMALNESDVAVDILRSLNRDLTHSKIPQLHLACTF